MTSSVGATSENQLVVSNDASRQSNAVGACAVCGLGAAAEPLVRGLFLVFGRSMEAANLPAFRNFGNIKTSDIYVIFAKKSWVATKLEGGWSKTRGHVPPGPGLEPPLATKKR